MVKGKKWIISKAVVGEPKLENFSMVEEELPPCKDGGEKLIIFNPIFYKNLYVLFEESLQGKVT